MFDRVGLAPFRVLACACCIVLCGFQSGHGRVLEIPKHAKNSSAGKYEDSGEVVPQGPDLRFHELLKFYGCWKSVVTRRELTAFAAASGGGSQAWTDKRYTICFARDMGGELEPTMSQVQAGGVHIEEKASSTELVGYDNHAVSLVNHYTFIDPNSTYETPKVSWFGLRRAPQPVEVRQVTNVSCLRENLGLVCTASAKAECGEESGCYSFAWKARFNAD